MTEEIKDLLRNLSPKELDVIILLFGLEGFPKSPEEIAQLYGVDKDTILQLAEQALPKVLATIEELKAISEKAQEELKREIAERKPKRVLSDIDSELLNIKFFETPENNL